MPETKTSLKVQAEPKGFQDLLSQASKLLGLGNKATKEQAKGIAKITEENKRYGKQVGTLEKELKSLTKTQLTTLKALKETKQGTEEYKKLEKVLKDVNKQHEQSAKILQKTKQLMGGRAGTPLTSQDMARGGFFQGLAQGSGVFPNLQRGPGMWRQGMGQAIGGIGATAPGAVFGGAGGFQQSLSAVSGIMGAQLSTAMGFGAGALGLQKAKLQALPFVGGFRGMGGRVAGARESARAGVSATGPILSDEMIERYSQEAAVRGTQHVQLNRAEQLDAKRTAAAIIRKRGYQGGMYDQNNQLTDAARKVQVQEAQTLLDVKRAKLGGVEAAKERELFLAPRRKFEEDQQRAMRQAESRERNKPFMGLRAAGRELGGLSEQEALQAVLPALQRGGGGMEEMRKQGMLQATIAAQTAFGINPGVAGSFLQAGRTGGLTGGKGRGGEAMTETIADAMTMGLEGSEINEYMQITAQGIQQWRTSGIPINSRSMAQMGRVFAGSGLGGVRGMALGRGVQQAAQRVSEGGPKDVMDLMMLQELGGFTGGTMEDLEAAEMRLESGDFAKGGLDRLMKRLTKAGGGGAVGRRILRKSLSKKGIKLGAAETKLLDQSLSGGALSSDAQKMVNDSQARMLAGTEKAPDDVEGLSALSKSLVGEHAGAVKRAARLQNQQNDVGAQMLGTLQTLQQSSMNVNLGFSTLAADGLKLLSDEVLSLTQKIKGAADAIDKHGWLGAAGRAVGVVAETQ